ncbi:hypothetical protein EDD86DRAFT_211300 [Gorgonomyces haynaldii]|nr:hypothetical protein EDD86DRAFT_211300 [Gorgonomyces haynaldii]
MLVAENEFEQKLQQDCLVYVYANFVDGKSWCGDCNNAVPFIRTVQESTKLPFLECPAGDRTHWREPSNFYRNHALLKTTNLPTLYLFKNGQVSYMLVEGECYDQSKIDAVKQLI